MDKVVPISDGFWNIRGSFRVFGLLDIGTQASLVRLARGGFVLLDSCTLTGAVEAEVRRLTRGGAQLEAIINLHPFHTVHVEAAARAFPNAKLYGTRRHASKFPTLAWQPERTETEAFAALYADDFDFTVPSGVDFVPSNENLHFASVLAIHKASRTLHVDDTLSWLPIPFAGRVGFHPTLGQVLQHRAGAVAEFRAWAESLIERSAEIEHLCTAHARLAKIRGAPAIQAALRDAYARIKATLDAHEARYG